MNKTYCFDIDLTICETNGTNYEDAKPIKSRISQINDLKKQGNKVIFYTARGFISKIDHYELTYNQLKSWEVNFDALYMGKPDADYYVDDKNVDIFGWF
jgi:CMP-N,N'-diacetyllegionaminic acid synthase